VTFNLTDLEFKSFSLDPSVQLVNLMDNNQMRLTIADFQGKINANYMYITDPPLLADIGVIEFDTPNNTIVI
jgi:hypothetical protein